MPGTHERRLVVVVDALGWITAERLGVLREEFPFRRRITTVFGYSSTAIPTLLTGAWPREHDHWFLFRRAGTRRPFREAGWIARLPGNLERRWRVRVRLQELWRRRLGITGYFSLYDVPFDVLARLRPTETEDIWRPGAFPRTPTLFDHLARTGEPHFVTDWRVPDEAKLAAARRALEEGDPTTVVLYLTEVDAVQHRVGTLHPEFDAAVHRAAEAVREMRGRLAERGPVRTTVVSDHGMTDVTRTLDVQGQLAAAQLVRGRDFECFLDSTVARFWNVARPAELKAALEGIDGGRWLPPEQLRAWGVDFPHADYGESFFLADPGVLVLPSDMGRAPLAAMHGYDPGDPTSDACLLADHEPDLERDHLTAVLPALLRPEERA